VRGHERNWPRFEQAFLREALESDVVSFDVFDTALLRTLADPRDVFDAVERGAIADGFAAARQDAEAIARARHCSEPGREDVTLDEIYACFGPSWRPADLVHLKALEIRTEADCLEANPEIRALAAKAEALGKTVVFTSDMYLPAQCIVDWLRREGYASGGAVFVSSAAGVSKATGRLFAYVAATLGVARDRILHVGDNEATDVRAARACGLRALRYRPPSTSPRTHTSPLLSHQAVRWRDEWRPAGRPALTGRAAVLDRVGFVLGAPLALGFCYWLAERVLDRFSCVYFCGRDGWALREAYERLRASQPRIPRSRYLIVSRRALCLPALGSLDDEMGRYLLSGFDPAMLAKWAGDSAAGAAPSALTLDMGDADIWRGLRHNEPAILAEAVDARARFTRYAKSLDLFSSPTAAIVDLGWNATQQIALSEIDRLNHGRTRIHGFYLGLYATARRLAHFGLPASAMLVTQDSSPEEQLQLQGSVTLLEALFSAPHGSVLGYGPEGHPRCEYPDFERRQWAAVAVFQRAVMRGIDAMLRSGDRPAVADARLGWKHLAVHPASDVAECCGRLRHTDGVNRHTAGQGIADVSGLERDSPGQLASRVAAAHWKWGLLARIAQRLPALDEPSRAVAAALVAQGRVAESPWDPAIIEMVARAVSDGVHAAYVYGAGEFGVRVALALRGAGVSVAGFVDSSRALHGLVVQGAQVTSLSEARRLGPHVYFVGSFAWASQIEGVIQAEYSEQVPPKVYSHRRPANAAFPRDGGA
jgi:HAD superfamily hydrolase (TIGR01549 family)